MSDAELSEVAKHLILPERIASTMWPRVRDRCASCDLHFDRWQDGLGRSILARRNDGTFACSVDGVEISMPRQVGKTFTIGGLTFGLCMELDGLTVIWTAHRTRTADETFRSMRGIAKMPGIKPFVSSVRATNGQQAVEFTNGSRILFGARESGFGRGFASVDILVLDEAQILTQKALDDMVPALNVSEVGLVLRLGTPPKPTDPGEAFTDFRRQALAGDIRDGLFVELGAADDALSDDRDQWRRANPSFPHRTPESSILRMRRQLGEESFRREGLGIWDPDMSSSAIPWPAWHAAEADPSEKPDNPAVCWGVRFSPDGSHVALGAAVKIDKVNSLVDGVRLASAGEGMDWLVSFLTAPERLSRTAQIVVDGKSGAGWLIDQLRNAGVSAKVIWTPTLDQIIGAHSLSLESVKDGSMRHMPNPVLDDEVKMAGRRKIGNLGGFGWQAPDGQTVALLESVTLANWAAKTTKRRPKGARTGKRVSVL